MVRFKKRITKALIRLRGCAGWSAPVLFANPRRQVFLRRGPIIIIIEEYILQTLLFVIRVKIAYLSNKPPLVGEHACPLTL